MKKQRKNYTAEEKVAILREHLLQKVPISDLCEKYEMHTTMFYRWQKDFFENGAVAFQQKNRANHHAEQERIDFLEKKIQRKDEVLAELMAEHIALKKFWGTLTGVRAATSTPPAGGMKPKAIMTVPGETEAGYAVFFPLTGPYHGCRVNKKDQIAPHRTLDQC